MADTLPSTPPRPSRLPSTPETPRFGWHDQYEPYSPRRKSTRISRRTNPESTPPPQSRHNLRKSTPSTSMTTSPLTSPSSPQTASKKRAAKAPSVIGGRRVSGALNMDNTATAAEALGLPVPRNESKTDAHHAPATVLRSNGMLPTPAKTPSKPPKETEPGVAAIAMRDLFDDAMPARKSRKKHAAFSFGTEEEAAPIQIYTDSQDRVPEVDTSEANPFYGTHTAPEPPKRRSKRQKILLPGEGEVDFEDLEHREDGYIAVFRGKKIFRKYEHGNERIRPSFVSAPDPDVEEALQSRLARPSTRSSVKKLLFPSAAKPKGKVTRSQLTEDEEEADTDVEDIMMSASKNIDQTVSTPKKASKFNPFSPPTTARVTRSKDIDMAPRPFDSDDESTPKTSRGKGEKTSPFDLWQRTRSIPTSPKKREGEPLGGPSNKKQRGSHM